MRYIVRSVCGDRVSSHRTLDGAARAKSKHQVCSVYAISDGDEYLVPLVIMPPEYCIVSSGWGYTVPASISRLVEAEAPSVR